MKEVDKVIRLKKLSIEICVHGSHDEISGSSNLTINEENKFESLHLGPRYDSFLKLLF